MAEGFYVTPMMAASKAEWIVKDLGRRAAGGLRLGTPDSWLAARLCGDVHASDHSNASATGLYDHFQAAWDARLLDALGLDGEMLPALVDSSQIVGTTNAATFGAEIPLAGLVADQQASLFAMRCVTRGLSKISYGTSASVNMTTGSEVGIGGAGTFPLVAWSIGAERTYCVEGQVITAGAAVQWLRDGLGLVREPAEVAALADGATDTGVWMIPALQGLGTPIAKPEARAVIGGLGAGSTAADIARAVLDGIAQRVADAAESVWQGSECTPERVRVDGGASVNDFLMQRQADLLGIPVERSAMRDGGALGAAMMAGLAARVWTDSGELDRLWRSDRTFEPRMSESERGDERDKWKRRLQTLVDAGV
jgi:glycerol kinase